MPQLGRSWLDCRLVGDRGVIGPLSAAEAGRIAPAYEKYGRRHVRAFMHPVWYDELEGICFGAAQFRGGPAGKHYNFLDAAPTFLEGRWGRRYTEALLRRHSLLASGSAEFGRELIYTNRRRLERHATGNAAIVLGGPTTGERDWASVRTDQTWTCNKFYLAPGFEDRQPDLVAFGADVPLPGNRSLIEILDRCDATILFDIETLAANPTQPAFALERYGDRVCFFHTRYNSALGLGVRLLCFAALLGLAEIFFVGLDGTRSVGPRHAFEPGKPLPRWFLRYGHGLQRRQYVVFWEYFAALQAANGFRFTNLGEGSDANISTPITRELAPLPKHLLDRLCGSTGNRSTNRA